MGKKLTHAPLFLTVAEIRFNPILSVESFVHSIQEQLRKHGYPDYQAAELVTFKLNQQDPASPTVKRVAKHSFIDMEKRAAFVLTPNTLSFHTTKYEVFETFVRDLMQGINVVHQFMSLAYTDRIGVRYLDAVLPRPKETLEQYLIPRVLGLATELDGELEQSFAQTRVRLSNGHLLARCLVRNGRLGLPQDLQSVGLELQERFTSFEGLHAVLDTDAAHEERQPYSASDIESHIYSLHEHIRTAFKTTVTDHALSAWE